MANDSVSKYFILKNSTLLLSVAIVVPASFVYGFLPDKFWIDILSLPINNTDIKNILKAIMGIYLGFSVLWILGILKSEYWISAQLSNIIFMGGLGIGRIISLFSDGSPSIIFLLGGFLEVALAIASIMILNKYK